MRNREQWFKRRRLRLRPKESVYIFMGTMWQDVLAIPPEENFMESRNLLRDVSDTALWVACYRAEEAERPDALFRDPYARRLAGERGPQIVCSLPWGMGKRMGWPMVVRTAVVNDIIEGLLEKAASAQSLNNHRGQHGLAWQLRPNRTASVGSGRL